MNEKAIILELMGI